MELPRGAAVLLPHGDGVGPATPSTAAVADRRGVEAPMYPALLHDVYCDAASQGWPRGDRRRPRTRRLRLHALGAHDATRAARDYLAS